jgi:hypothetical protein
VTQTRRTEETFVSTRKPRRAGRCPPTTTATIGGVFSRFDLQEWLGLVRPSRRETDAWQRPPWGLLVTGLVILAGVLALISVQY